MKGISPRKKRPECRGLVPDIRDIIGRWGEGRFGGSAMLGDMHSSSSATVPEAEAIAALQREIWLAKVARARAMTPDERVAEISTLTSQAFTRMHAAAMADLGATDPAAGWVEVRRRLDRIRAARDAGRFVATLPAERPASP